MPTLNVVALQIMLRLHVGVMKVTAESEISTKIQLQHPTPFNLLTDFSLILLLLFANNMLQYLESILLMFQVF